MNEGQIFVLVFAIGVLIATILAKKLQMYEQEQQEKGDNK